MRTYRFYFLWSASGNVENIISVDTHPWTDICSGLLLCIQVHDYKI